MKFIQPQHFFLSLVTRLTNHRISAQQKALAVSGNTMADFTIGEYGNFHWIEFPENDLVWSDLLKKQPDIFLNKYIAVVCFDSGPLVLTPEEKLNGWNEENGIAYSPKLTRQIVSELPYEQHDQWCLFNEPTKFERMTHFVNYGRFSLTNRKKELIDADPTWDKVGIARQLEQHEQLLEQFWYELKNIDPFNYIANGDNLIFVSKDMHQIESLKKYCR